MSKQLDLFEIPKSPKLLVARDHLFFAIFLDTNTAKHVAQLAGRLQAAKGLRGNQLAADRLHVSLHSFHTPSGVVDALVHSISDAAAAVAASAPPFRVNFDRVCSFSGKPGNRPLVLRAGDSNAALIDFFERLTAELGRRGFPSKGKLRFTPHVTLFYGDPITAEETIEPVGWAVKDFVLIHSLVGKTRYILRGRWTLQG